MTDKRYNNLQLFGCGLLYFLLFELKKCGNVEIMQNKKCGKRRHFDMHIETYFLRKPTYRLTFSEAEDSMKTATDIMMYYIIFFIHQMKNK